MMRKRGRGAMIAVFLTTLVIFGLIYGAWSTIATVFEPPAATHAGPITLVVKDGESTAQIADDLYTHSLIRNPLAFRLWARVKGLDTQLHAGAYILTPGMSIDSIVAKLLQQQPDEKRLAIIDGWRVEQIADQANALGLVNFKKEDFSQYTHHPERFPDRARYPILRNATSMEGLLFPDTYLIPLNYTTVQVIDMMLDEFMRVVEQNNLLALAQHHQLPLYTMVVLASIVQREAANAKQMPLIAGIYWKRIYEPSADVGSALLAADPTVQYARDTDTPPTSGASYWGPLEDTGGKVDPASLWNTYTHQGWPPTPIASPGLAALMAAASPAQTNCYYFFSKQDGSLVCAPTYAQILQKE